jgi:hypothetical protein
MPQSNRPSLSQHIPVDSHHDVLSINNPDPKQRLLSFIQAGSMDPMDMIFSDTPVSNQFNLNHVVLEPAVQEEAPPTSVILETGHPLSKSLLWKIQEDFYSSMGINAWDQNVPCFITSSVYMAECYADMILAFLRDYMPYLNLDEPIYILEMATGTGRFSHLMLKELEKKLSYFEQCQKVSIKYIMTDFTDSNPIFWENHEKFKPYIDKGLLDFAVFNPLIDQSFTLRLSGQQVSSDIVKNPMIAIANYFFDTILQDVFRVESKRLQEGTVTLERNLEGIDPESAPHISQITPSFTYRELRTEKYYDDARMNDVLRFYKHNIKNGTLIFPLGALQVTGNLLKLSHNNLMLLSSDKAFNSYEYMTRYYQHDYVIHDGAFSYMVNYDAISRYFTLGDKGKCYSTESHNLSLQTVCCLELDHPECAFEQMQYLFREKIDRWNPINTICTLLPEEFEKNPIAKLEYWLAYIRLNLADPKIFGLVTKHLIDNMGHITPVQQQDLLRLMAMAAENYYYFPGEVNLPFWFSQLFFSMSMYHESVECLDNAMNRYGAHEALLFLKGQSYEKLNLWTEAGAMYEKALELQPGFREAWDALMSVNTRGSK